MRNNSNCCSFCGRCFRHLNTVGSVSSHFHTYTRSSRTHFSHVNYNTPPLCPDKHTYYTALCTHRLLKPCAHRSLLSMTVGR